MPINDSLHLNIVYAHLHIDCTPLTPITCGILLNSLSYSTQCPKSTYIATQIQVNWSQEQYWKFAWFTCNVVTLNKSDASELITHLHRSYKKHAQFLTKNYVTVKCIHTHANVVQQINLCHAIIAICNISYRITHNAWSEIQFWEFMGGSNVTQASPNYLICMRFIRINMVVYYISFCVLQR